MCGIESFVQSALSDEQLPFPPKANGKPEDRYDIGPLPAKHFDRIPYYAKLTSELSPHLAYSERIELFRKAYETSQLATTPILWALPLHMAINRNYTDHNDRTGAEVFTQFVSDLRTLGKTRQSKTELNKQRQNAKRLERDFIRYVQQLFEYRSHLVVLRLDLYYQSSTAPSMSTLRATADLDHLLNNRRNNKTVFGGLVGHIALLDYDALTGLSWRVLFFFDGSVCVGSNHIFYANNIGDYWCDTITKGLGDYRNWQTNCGDHTPLANCGIGDLHYSADDFDDNLAVRVVRYLCKRQQYFWVTGISGTKRFRKGKSPK